MASLSDIRALVVTLDPVLRMAFSDLFRAHGVDVRSSAVRDVPEELGREKYEALLVDFDTVSETAPILSTLRGSPSNKGAVVLAVATGAERKKHAFSLGANFVFERPLKIQELRRTLHAAYDLMHGERRRYFRCAVNLPVRLTRDSGENIECSTMNVSSSGMAVATPVPLRIAESLDIAFSLPDGSTILATTTVVWDDKHGKSGLHFQCNTSEMRHRLDSWLGSQFAALHQ
jgi:DNA-binding response OmpR family regulator